MKLFSTHIKFSSLLYFKRPLSRDYPTVHEYFMHPTKMQLTYGCGTSQADVI